MDKKTILLVDDDPDILESTGFMLEAEGYHVVTAGDGFEALETARRLEPDLMVLDVMMPGENGYRVCKALKEDQQAGRISKTIPIVLLTARNLAADPEREEIFMDFSQANRMMYKPFELDELLKCIQGLLAAQ